MRDFFLLWYAWESLPRPCICTQKTAPDRAFSLQTRGEAALCAVREGQTLLTLAKRPHEFKLADVVGAHLYGLLNPGPKPDP